MTWNDDRNQERKKVHGRGKRRSWGVGVCGGGGHRCYEGRNGKGEVNLDGVGRAIWMKGRRKEEITLRMFEEAIKRHFMLT